ncbi:DUF485 domain-containing protein [Streptomyces sp. FL07-04A]|uniref:DUF485 domain-containing protein n=1 Tax=Streptomyces sp. FL07-04A TaxID=3028658 RepID=UPI0029AE9333|nr:DUF485 domain-containing protein [Streptomyces sp. FL07-04A]MDX3578562.1 DUF485 domain-containing protein [Streptomyces sp. FL07-04A]
MSHDPSFPHPSHPHSSYPRPSHPEPTYPWQPPPPQPEPQRPRPDRHAPVGRHSDLRILRGAYRRQRRVATLTALGYFVVFLVLSAYAPSLMTGTPAPGLPAGLLLALLQLPVTWLAIVLYERTARRHVDPLADRIRKLAEIDARRDTRTARETRDRRGTHPGEARR